MTLVSIIIPLYNAELYIVPAIESVIRQTYKNWELIIINDGSSDRSVESIASFIEGDRRIRLFSIPNSGVSCARNYGISLATGSYIAFLDADDIWYSTKLETQVSIMAVDSSILWSIPSCDTIDQEGKIQDRNLSKAPITESHFEELITWTSPSFVAMSGLVVNRALLGQIRFAESISSPADKEFMIQLAKISNATYIPESLWQYRILTNSMSRNSSKVADDMLKMYEDYTDDFYGTKKLKHHALYRVNYICYRTYLKNKELQKGLLSFSNYLINRIQYSCNS